MPLPDSYDPSAERKLTWIEWFQTSDPFLKATLAGMTLGTTLGGTVHLIKKNKRLTAHVGWVTYISSTAILWLNYNKHNAKRLGNYNEER